MADSRIRSFPAILLAVLTLGSAGCAVRPAPDQRPVTDAWRAAVTDTIRAAVNEHQPPSKPGDCEAAADAPPPLAGQPYAYFAAQDRVIRLETRDELLALCKSIARDRLSATEEIEDQTVNLVTHDVAYVVTRSVHTTRWQDGRTQALPTVETAIVARQGDRWQVLFKHLSWREPVPEPQ